MWTRWPSGGWLPKRWQRLGGPVSVAACYALPIIWPQVFGWTTHLFWSVWFNYGEILSFLPGTVYIILAAPVVGRKRKDAWAILFPPKGIRVAWVVGARLAQLPERPWPQPSHEGVVGPSQQLVSIVDLYRNLRRRPIRGIARRARLGQEFRIEDRANTKTYGTEYAAGNASLDLSSARQNRE